MKYHHVWFQTKYKKYLLVDIIESRIHEILKEIADEKGICLLASGSLLDHMHLLIGVEDGQALPKVVKLFKGISSRKIFQEYLLLKEDFKVNNFWARRYGTKEIPAERIQTVNNYVLNQKKNLL